MIRCGRFLVLVIRQLVRADLALSLSQASSFYFPLPRVSPLHEGSEK